MIFTAQSIERQDASRRFSWANKRTQLIVPLLSCVPFLFPEVKSRGGAEINVPRMFSVKLFIGGILSFNCVTELKHEMGHLFGVSSSR